MTSLTPKAYVFGLTAAEIEQRLNSLDNFIQKDVIRQSLSSPSADTIPSTQAVVDALVPIQDQLESVGDLAGKDSVSLDSEETVGVLPLNKGGTGGNTVELARQNLGILTQDEIQNLINESVTEIGSVDLSSPQVTNVLPMTKGGTGANTPSQARANLGVWSSAQSEVVKTNAKEALRRSYAEAGYNLVAGSFEAGGVLVNANDVLLHETSGKAYTGPTGTVDAGTNPASGGFTDVSSLRIYRNFGSVANMLSWEFTVGEECFSGETKWLVTSISSPMTLANFRLLSKYANIRDFGVFGTGLDYTSEIKYALLHAKRVYLPEGDYSILGGSLSGETALDIQSFSRLKGDGLYLSRIKVLGNTINGISANPNNGGTTDVADNVRDVIIEDISFTAELTSFREFQHHINLSAVSDVTIRRCGFFGWRGDAIYLGSGTGVERHNEDVTVEYCIFDGINKANRNGISVIDCDRFTAQFNLFTRCTRSDMPGAIDIEPNPYTYHVVRNITIQNNSFYDIGGDTGVICFAIPGLAYTKMPRTFRVLNNYINGFGVNRGVYFRYNTDGTGTVVGETFDDFDVTIEGNTIMNGKFPVVHGNVKGLRIRNNVFQDIDAGLSYYSLTDVSFDTEIKGNTFLRCGRDTSFTANNYGMQVANSKRLDIVENTFIDCGRASGGFGTSIYFRAGSSSGVKLIGNTFASPSSRTTAAVRAEAGHTFLASSNIEGDNLYLNSLTSTFKSTPARLSWDAAVAGSTSAGNATYTKRNANYTVRNGKVDFEIELAWTGATGTGAMYITLPSGFQPVSSAGYFPVSVAFGANTVALLNVSNGRIELYNTTSGSLVAIPVATSGTIYLSGSYNSQ